MSIVSRMMTSAGIVAACAGAICAYEEWSMPNLTAPTLIESPALEAEIQHQFQGTVNEFQAASNFFGVADGADVHFGIRATILPGAQLFTFYDTHQYPSYTYGEYIFGGSYGAFFHPLYFGAQLDGQFVSYVRYSDNERITKPYLQLSLQNDPLAGRVVFLVNTGYSFDINRYGLGTGVDVKVTEVFDLYGEYFPWVDKNPSTSLEEGSVAIQNPFSFGVKINTAGHQFFIFAGNATEIGAENLMRGTLDKQLRIGFTIKRLFKLNHQ